MDDLLDLNWDDSKAKQNKPTSSAANEKPKDAFADLLSTSTKKTVDVSKLSLLERQKLQQQQQSPVSWNTTPQSTATPRTSTTPLSPSTTPLTSTPPPSKTTTSTTPKSNTFLNVNTSNPKQSSSFDNLLDSFNINSSKNNTSDRSTPLNQLRNVSTPDSNAGDSWDFDLLDSKFTSIPVSTTNSTSTPTTSNDDPFDVDTLAQHTMPSQLQVEVEEQDDNPLGILAKPATTPVQVQREEVEEVQHEPEFDNVEDIQEREAAHKLALTEEEEDEKLAQLIDMGFSLQESKFAIEATLGQDMQAAIDLLVQSSETIQRLQPSSTPSRSENQRNISQNERARNALFSDEAPPQHTRRNQQPEPGHTDDTIQAQTDKLVNQAQEIGGFLYKNAASYFKAGKDRVTKAVGDWQEQQRTQRLEEQRGPVRPKWMAGGDDIVDASSGSVERFKDDDDESDHEADRSMVDRRRMEEMQRKQRIKQQEAAAAHKLRQQQQLKKDLFEDDQTTYVSPSRRRGGTPKSDKSMSPAPSKNAPVKTSTPPPQKSAPQAPPPKKNVRTRPVINASPEALSKASKARSVGNEKFKVGQFGEAEEAYSQAIDILPSGHDLHVLLYNNRAATRLKTGDYKKCIEDCDLVFDLCKQSGDGSVTIEGVTINWRDQLVKSLYRKAEAFENIEKYNDALTTYDQLIKYEGTTNPKINQSMSRCRQALNPKKSTPKPKSAPSQASTPKKPDDLMAMFDPTKSTTSASSTPVASEEELSKSKAVAAMRAKAAEKEAEDAEKLQKVDDVNARILAWKAGKEQNLRALLATLDTLLWPGAQWKGAQMSELINPKKCKITYMKAIGKVHPDKLSSDTSVEHRMLASGIFAALNEAWDAFKGQNQL